LPIVLPIVLPIAIPQYRSPEKISPGFFFSTAVAPVIAIAYYSQGFLPS
jgi:hypothetical protein